MHKAVVKVSLKKKILDPQGKAIESSLHNLGFTNLSRVRTGRTIEITVDENQAEAAFDLVRTACTKLLANPVTEEYEFELLDGTGNSIRHFSSVTAAAQHEKVRS